MLISVYSIVKKQWYFPFFAAFHKLLSEENGQMFTPAPAHGTAFLISAPVSFRYWQKLARLLTALFTVTGLRPLWVNSEKNVVASARPISAILLWTFTLSGRKISSHLQRKIQQSLLTCRHPLEIFLNPCSVLVCSSVNVTFPHISQPSPFLKWKKGQPDLLWSIWPLLTFSLSNVN